MKLSLSHNSCVQIIFLQLLLTLNVVNCISVSECVYPCLSKLGTCANNAAECAQSCHSNAECLQYNCCKNSYCLNTTSCPAPSISSSQFNVLPLVIGVPVGFFVLMCICALWKPIARCIGSIQLRRAISAQHIQVSQGSRVQGQQNPGDVIFGRQFDRNPFEEQQIMIQQLNNPPIVQLGQFNMGQSQGIPINMVYLPDPELGNVNSANKNQPFVVNPLLDSNPKQEFNKNKILPFNHGDTYL